MPGRARRPVTQRPPRGLDGGVGGVGDEHSGGHAGLQVVDDVRGDDLPGSHDGHAGRVGGEHLGGDTSDGLVRREVLGLGEGGVPGKHRLLEFESARCGKRHGRPVRRVVGVADEAVRGVDEQTLGAVVGGRGDLPADPAGAGGADVDVAVGARPFGGLHAADAQATHIDGDLQRVQFHGQAGVHRLSARQPQPGHGVDRRANACRAVECRLQQLSPRWTLRRRRNSCRASSTGTPE